MPRPLVSVVMPVYNAESYLSEAIESILAQSYTDFEFIIVDDCSTDCSWEIAHNYAVKDRRIILMKNKCNSGIAITLNTGIKAAKGTYIARMDADDVAVPHRFQRQIEFLAKHPEVGVVGTAVYLIDEKGKVVGERYYHEQDSDIRRHLFRFSPFAHPTVMMVKEVVIKAGLYNPSLVPVEDYDLWFRIGRISKFANLREPLLYYRISESGTTMKKLKEMQRGTLKVRVKAWKEYGYKMNLTDVFWFIGGSVVPLFLPSRATIKVFEWVRRRQV